MAMQKRLPAPSSVYYAHPVLTPGALLLNPRGDTL